ncbi:formate/nitrite transporter family protein [Lactococcus lactis]
MISFGYLLYIRVVASVAEELGSLASLIGASVFPIGLIVILLGGGELITSNMTAVSTSLFAKKVSLSDLLKNWLIITLFNVIGAIFVAFVFGHLVGLTGTGDYKTELLSLAQAKINASWSQEFLSGIGCNWFVGLAMLKTNRNKSHHWKPNGQYFPCRILCSVTHPHS